MELPKGMKKSMSQIMDAMKKPVVHSSTSLDCQIYNGESADEPRASFKTSCSHSIKLVDLVLGAAIMTVICCTAHKMSKSKKCK